MLARRSRLGRLVLSIAFVAVLAGPLPPGAHAAPIPKCFGEPATKVAERGVDTEGTSGPDVIVGTAYNDTIDGLGGDDLICGLGGNDLIRGDLGPADPASGDDRIDGGDGDDSIFAGPGADGVIGGFGGDIVGPGSGADDVEAEPVGSAAAGSDQIAFFYAHGPMTVDLAAGTAAGEGGDTFSGFAHASGGCFDDVIYGTDQGNALFGGPGNDQLYGEEGMDSLQGDFAFPRNRTGVTGCDRAPGDDVLLGGPDRDHVAFYGVRPNYLGLDVGVDVDLAAGTAVGQGADDLVGIEQVSGSDADDTLYGDAMANTFWPEGGNDHIEGRSGTDTISYSDLDTYFIPRKPHPSGSVDVDLGAGLSIVLLTVKGERYAESDTFTGIESASGSGFDDTLNGSPIGNFLTGLGGDDRLYGLGDDDVLNGGTGDDLIDGGSGTRDIGDFFLTDGFNAPQRICAALGVPDIDVSSICGSDIAGLARRDADGDKSLVGAGDETDRLTGLEGLEGDSFRDILIGSSSGDELYGLAGDDLLLGGIGDDFLDGDGQAGTYTWLRQGKAGDALVGGTGTDQCSAAEDPRQCEGTNPPPAHPILVAANEAQLEIAFDDDRTKRSGI